jgi:hypothetical protein
MGKTAHLPLAMALAMLVTAFIINHEDTKVTQEFLQQGFNFSWMALYLYGMNAVELVVSGLLLTGIMAGAIFSVLQLVKTCVEKFLQEGFNFSLTALYIIV